MSAWFAQRLDAPGRGTGSDRDDHVGDLAHVLDPFRVARGRDRSLDDRHVVGPLADVAGHLQEVGDLDLAGQGEQFVLRRQQRQLAAVAGGELPHGDAWSVVDRLTISRTSSNRETPATGTPGRPGRRTPGRADNGRRCRRHTACCVRGWHGCRCGGDAPSQRRAGDESHHDLGPAGDDRGGVGVEGRAVDQPGHDADRSLPPRAGPIDDRRA